MADLGKRIYAARKALDLTLEIVGQYVGVGKSTVRKWENGMIKNMRRDKIKKLSEILEVSPGYLMGWTDDPHDYNAGGKSTASSHDVDSLYMDDPLTAALKAEIDTLSPSHKELLLAQIQIMKARNSK